MLVAIVLNACQTTDVLPDITSEVPTDNSMNKAPVRTAPIDVVSSFITPQAITPQAVSIAQGNLFDNGGFESGLAGWTGCAAGAIAESSDAYEGAKALKLNTGNCFYRSAEVGAGQELTLSCYVKLESGSAWTGMGMGFANASWTAVGQAPTTVITGTNYARYDVKATAPATSKYASMWLYSDNPALVDNCSLMLEIEPPPPPLPSGENLLENSDFINRVFVGDATYHPKDWGVGCEGSVDIFPIRAARVDSDRGLSVKDGACVDQSLSASDVAELQGNAFAFTCFAKNNGGYASFSVFLDGNPISKVIPLTESYQLITIPVSAQSFSSAFVSIYSEGNLQIVECGLTTGLQGVPNKPRILIGSQRRLGNPAGERVLVRLWNTGNQPLTNIKITSADLADCNLDLESLAIDKQYLYECSTGPLAPGTRFFTTLTVTAQSPDGQTTTRSASFRIESAVGTGNFLENHLFFSRDTNNKPTEWNKGCGGSWNVPEGTNRVQLYGGACMDQAFSVGEIEVLKGKTYQLVCALSQTGGYASMSVFLDGVLNTKVIPLTTDPDGFENITLTGTAGQDVTEGFVSFYSEGDVTNNLTLSSCSFNIVQ